MHRIIDLTLPRPKSDSPSRPRKRPKSNTSSTTQVQQTLLEMTSKRTTHAQYNKIGADIVLCSSNDILFKLNKTDLIATSTFFRDMFASPALGTRASATGTGTRDEIPFDATSVDLCMLLDLCNAQLENPQVPNNTASLRRILLLCEKYGFRYAQERMLFRYLTNGSIHANPWETFVMASQLANLALARAALEKMGVDKNVHRLLNFGSITRAMAADVDPAWLVPVLSKIDHIKRTHPLGQHALPAVDWVRFAREFTVLL